MSGFQSPNYTQTPNDLFDKLLPEMGLAELKVVMCIVRHTFGYHRDEVKISIRTLARMTGLTVNSVMDGAGQAENHGMIERYIDGNKTTLWRAVVSVVPSKTRRLTSRDAGVVPTKTLVGGKERKKETNKWEDVEALSKTSRAYETEIGLITSMIADELQDASTTYPLQWILDAIHEAATQNKRNWKYCLAILKRWKAQGSQDPSQKKTDETHPEYKIVRADEDKDEHHYIPNPYRKPKISA
jgi:DnaD/phage-associated family protein